MDAAEKEDGRIKSQNYCKKTKKTKRQGNNGENDPTFLHSTPCMFYVQVYSRHKYVSPVSIKHQVECLFSSLWQTHTSDNFFWFSALRDMWHGAALPWDWWCVTARRPHMWRGQKKQNKRKRTTTFRRHLINSDITGTSSAALLWATSDCRLQIIAFA